MDSVPNEVLERVILKLDFVSLKRMQRVSRNLNGLVDYVLGSPWDREFHWNGSIDSKENEFSIMKPFHVIVSIDWESVAQFDILVDKSIKIQDIDLLVRYLIDEINLDKKTSFSHSHTTFKLESESESFDNKFVRIFNEKTKFGKLPNSCTILFRRWVMWKYGLWAIPRITNDKVKISIAKNIPGNSYSVSFSYSKYHLKMCKIGGKYVIYKYNKLNS